MDGLEIVYRRHHTKDGARKRNHAILIEARKDFIQQRLGVNKKILDIGCRDGELIKHYNNQHNILGLDIDTEALEIAQAKTGIEVRRCDLNGDWEVVPNSYDGVVACEVIEHLYHPQIVLEKIYASLKPGGVLVGSIPHAFNLQTRIKLLLGIKHLTPLGDPTHINHFSANEFKQLLSKNFTDIEVVGVTTEKYRLLQPIFPYLFAHTLLFSAKKPL